MEPLRGQRIPQGQQGLGLRRAVSDATDQDERPLELFDGFILLPQLGADEAYRASFNIANTIAAYACVATWQADFRSDLPKIDIPVLVIQGDADRILPFDKTGKRLPGLIAKAELVVVEGGPHAIPWTHTDEVNAALLRFLGHPAA